MVEGLQNVAPLILLGGVKLVKNNSPNVNENELKNNLEKIVEIGIDRLKNFEKHPFKVLDETLEELTTSITENGITTPLIVRPLKDENYEIVSGHRRKRACELLGITKVPCIVRDISRDEAIIQMVDSNIQREEVLPSERAFAYKMKLDAMKRKAGRPKKENSRQVVGNLESAEMIGKEVGESGRQIQRYIRLTELIPELLEMVDLKRIAFNPAYEISFLSESEQKMLFNTIEFYGQTPSIEQARELKRLSQSYELNEDVIDDIMSEEKGNQIPKINISYTKVQKFLPRNVVTPKEIQDYFVKCVLVCKERGINVEKLDIKIDYDEPQKAKSKDRDSR